MALALCLTLLPAPAWAAEADAPEGGTIVQEEKQEKAPAAESPAILEQAAENGIAAQNGGDGIAVQAASAEKTENFVASVVIDGTTSYYDTLRKAIMAAGEKAGSNGTPPTITLLQNGVELRYPQYNSAEKRDDPTYPVIVDMGGNSLSSVYFLYDTLTLTGGTVNGTGGADLRSGGSLIMTAPEDAEAAVSGPLKIINIFGQVGTANVSGAKIGVKGTLRVESSAANAVVISGSEKAVELDSEAYLSSGGRFYGSAEENGSPDTVAVYDADQKTYTVNGVTAKKLVSGPKTVVAVTPGDTLSVMAGEAQEYTAQFTAEGVVSGSVKGLGDLQATVGNGDANDITVNVAENAADGTWKVTVQTAESTPLGTYTLNLLSAVDGAVSGSVTFTVSETKYAASVGEQNYRSLSAAVDAAKATSGTVKLLENVTGSITVTDGKFTIDLNGKTWTGASDSRALTVNGGEVTLSSTGGAGTIVGSDHNKYAVWVDSGTVHLKKNVKLTERLFIKDENGGSVTFEPGVTVTKNIMTSSHSVVRFMDGLALQNASKGYVPFYNVPTNRNPLGYVTVVDHPAHHMVDGVCDQCGYVCGHSNAKAEDTVCPVCGAAFIAAATAADGTVTRYTNADAALAAAAGNAKVTFVPGTYTLKNTVIFSGRIETEIDLNGATLQYASGDQDVVLLITEPYENITITLKNGTVQNTGTGTGIALYSTTYGSTRTVLTLEDVTVIGGTNEYSGYSINVANRGNTLTVKSGSFSGPLNLNLANNTVKLYGGTYQNGIKTYDKTAKDYAALLDNSEPAKQYAYADGSGSVITYDEVATRMNDSDSTNNSIQVKEHTHTMGGTNTCTQCGFTCAQHDWSKKNGVCTVCGYHCPHNAGAAEADGVWACNTCGQTVTAKVVAPDGSTTTYYADGYVNNNVKSGLYFAIKAAKTGSTVTALGGEYSGGYVTGGKTLTLDVSNGKTISGILYVGDVGEKGSVNKLIVRGSTEISDVIVAPGDNTLDLTGWTGRIGSLTVQNGGKATLNGGTFATLYINGATAGSLLAEGYAFQNAGTGAYVECSSTADMENVEVVKCPHADAKDGTCLYCGQTGIMARVGDTIYDSVSSAVAAWLTNGGTLKLFDDYGQSANGNALDLISAEAAWLAIDLNGHGFYKDCQGDIKLGGGKRLTITDSSGKGTGVFGPVTADRGTLTLESGCLEKLTVPSSSTAKILLRGGKVTDILYPVPIFDLLEDGYALMSGDNPVDPAKSLFGSGVYTIKNSQTQFIDAQKNGEAAIDSNTIPFALSLKTADSEIGQMGFTWYIVKEDGTTQELAATTSDVTPGTNGVYTCNAANMTVNPDGWTDLKANETYKVLCVVNGKTSDGTSKWQTPMRGYQLTVNKATPTGTPKYTAITKEGQTLADANLTAEGENKESLFKALGTAIQGIVKWVESEDKTTALNLGTKVEQGKTYTWLFTPTDQNYKELSGAIVLWAKPSSGGFVTPVPVNPDVITVKEDTKDNTTSKPGAETGTTTTKTTVKHTTTETTKNEQGQDVSKTTASVSKDLGDKLLDQAVSNKSDTIEITVKSNETNNNGSGAGASAADSVKATEVELPKATVNAIAKDTNADLVIKTDSGEVTLDNKTLETIAKEAKGDSVRIVVNENTKLTEAQKPAEKIIGEKGKLFDLAASIGEKLIHHFGGGKAHVTLPMPEGLKGKDVLVIYINDKGFCEILNHTVEKVGADSFIKFTTSHFSTFAVVDKEEAEALIKAQNEAHVKELMQNGKFKVTTTKTSKKSVKVTVTAKNNKTLISDIKTMGYTVKYQFYRSTKKTSGYKLLKTKTTSSFTNTKGKKGTKYYYKARVLVYDGKTLIAKSELKQASCGVRTWTK